MKNVIAASSVFLGAIFMVGCADNDDRYVDLVSGKGIEIQKDEVTGAMVNKETGDPVYIYVDTRSNDTIYGKSGKVINGHVVLRDNKYVYTEDEKLDVEDGQIKFKDGDDYKVEIEKDGDVKIKDGDTKTKIDGETGERKVKKDN